MNETGPRLSRKSRYAIPESDPINMFCGLPVMVAALPMFEAVARANKYGTAGLERRLHTCKINGAMKRHTTSLTRKADKIPLVKMTLGNKCRGATWSITRLVIHSK